MVKTLAFLSFLSLILCNKYVFSDFWVQFRSVGDVSLRRSKYSKKRDCKSVSTTDGEICHSCLVCVCVCVCVCQSSVRRHCLCHAQCLAQEQSTNAIDNPLLLTLIKMEHVQEIKLSLSHRNEMVSITQLFSSQ